MNYLLDTCVLSEYTRPKPNRAVIQWVDGIAEEKLFISVVTIGEIQHGIQRLPNSKRKTTLLVWMNDAITKRFANRMFPLDVEIMLRWGSLSAELENSGHPMPIMDTLIAATGLVNNLVLVTRNVTDFQYCGVQMINPWDI